jgi:hypothetical protein
LAGDKRVIVAISRGGFYGPGAPTEALEHLETYLRGVFGFIGVTQLEFISADASRSAPSNARGQWRAHCRRWQVSARRKHGRKLPPRSAAVCAQAKRGVQDPLTGFIFSGMQPASHAR